jgi:thioesterase domain-containing protein
LEPTRLPVRSVLFRSEEYPPGAAADLGWAALIGPLDVVQARGTHLSMFEPPACQELAASFERALTAAAHSELSSRKPGAAT